jgi:hypothetical protein
MIPYGMIASAAGSIIQNIAGNLAQQKMDKVFQRELDNQARYRNQAFGFWQPAVQQQGTEQAGIDLAQGEQRRNDLYGQMQATPLALNEQQTGRGRINAELMGNNRARLGAYSDWRLNNAIRQIRLQDELNRISNFSAGDASVFPGLMQDAQHSQDKLAMIGKIIASLGGAGGAFGAYGSAVSPSTSGTEYMGSVGGIDAGSGFGGQYSGQV